MSKNTDSASQGVTAWHGTPAEFEQFSTEYISGGEGVQAYGWGLYFATEIQVAKWYRDALAGNNSAVWVGDQHIPKITIDDIQEKNQRYVNYQAAFFIEAMGYGGAKERILNDIDEKKNRLSFIPAIAEKNKEDVGVLNSVLEKIEEWKDEVVRLDKGRMYQVHLEPRDDEYLQWDKEMKDQSESVLNALRSNNIEFIATESGKDLYEGIVGNIESLDNKKWHTCSRKLALEGHDVERYTPPEIASRYLNSIGVPGLKFMDQNSRSNGVGTSNYVVFDENNVSVLSRYRKNPSYQGHHLKQPLSPEEIGKAIAPLVSDVGVEARIVSDFTELPRHVLREMVRDYALEDAAGVFDARSGQAFLIAQNIKSPKEAVQSYLHEVKGHAAFRAALGDKYAETLDKIYQRMPEGLIENYRKEYENQLSQSSPKEQKRIIAEEWVAGIAERNPKNTLVESVAAVVRGWLRKVKPDLSFSNNEIVAFLEKGTRILNEKAQSQSLTNDVASSFSENYSKKDLSRSLTNAGVEQVSFGPAVQYHSIPAAKAMFSLSASTGNHKVDTTIYHLENRKVFPQVFSSGSNELEQSVNLGIQDWATKAGIELVGDPEQIKLSEAAVATPVADRLSGMSEKSQAWRLENQTSATDSKDTVKARLR